MNLIVSCHYEITVYSVLKHINTTIIIIIMFYYRLAEHINRYMTAVQYIVSALSTRV